MGLMDLNAIPLFGMLRGRMGYLGERQKVIAQNVANSSTPGFTPSDLKPFDIKLAMAAAGGGQGGLAPAMTAANHIAGRAVGAKPAFKPVRSPDTETTLDGNSVVLEDEMMKMTQARVDYDAAIGFYQRSLGLLRMAIRRPGQG